MRCHLPNKHSLLDSVLLLKQALMLAIASCFAAPALLLAQEVATGEEVLPDVRIIATTPVGSTGIPITKFAGNVQTINQKDMPRDVQGFTDVLNQNIGFYRNATSNYINENTYVVLKRYFMFSLTYNFIKAPGN
jgi:hypothetical protein